jgi:hypothetical protein
MQTLGAITVNAPTLPISAAKPRRDQRRRRGGRTIWRNIDDHGDDLIKLGKIARETRSAIGCLFICEVITKVEAEAARRYAYIVARFEKYCVPTRRNNKSPSYEKAFGADQELERHNAAGTTADYEARARKAKREYDKLMKAIWIFGPAAKSVIDDLCCSDIEVASQFHANLAIVLRKIAKTFGITAEPRARR